MRPEMLTATSALAVAVVTAVGGIATTMVGRRQPRGAQRRDDFTAVTDRLGQHVERLERRIDDQEAESERDRERITAQDHTIRYLTAWVRSLVGYIRAAQMEPPPPPQPVPPEVQPYLHDVGF